MRVRGALVLCAAVAAAGCHKEQIPYLGYWHGGFEVDDSVPKADAQTAMPRGYLQLYRTHDKFLIELANQIQVLDLGGTWKMLNSHSIELTFHDFRLNEPDVDKLKAMRRSFIDPAALREVYGKPMVLHLSADGKTLEGLLVHIGPLLGKHRFIKGE